MAHVEQFRLRIEGVFNISGRGTAVLGPILSGAVSIGDVLVIEGREDRASARCVAIDAAPRALRTLEDGLPRVGLVVPAWTRDDVFEGDVLIAVDPA